MRWEDDAEEIFPTDILMLVFLPGFGVVNSLTETVIEVTFHPHRCQTVDTKFEVFNGRNDALMRVSFDDLNL